MLAAGRAPRRRTASPASWSTPRPDLREQLLDADVDWLDAVLYHPRARRPHPRHRRSARRCSSASAAARRCLSRRADLAQSCTPASAIASRRRPAASIRRSLTEHRLAPGQAGDDRRAGRPDRRPCRSCRTTATSPRSASASAAWPIPATSAACRPKASRRSPGLDVWIVDALRYKPHPSHFSVAEALAWIERLKPQARDPDQHARRPRLRGAARASCRRMSSRPMTACVIELTGLRRSGCGRFKALQRSYQITAT